MVPKIFKNSQRLWANTAHHHTTSSSISTTNPLLGVLVQDATLLLLILVHDRIYNSVATIISFEKKLKTGFY